MHRRLHAKIDGVVAGMGYATAFSMELGGISADFNADLSVNSAVDLTISGNIGSNIGDFAFAAATTLGFTLTTGSTASPSGHVNVALECGGSCSNIFGDILDLVKRECGQCVSFAMPSANLIDSSGRCRVPLYPARLIRFGSNSPTCSPDKRSRSFRTPNHSWQT